MKSKCTRRFWKLDGALPKHVQLRTDKSYQLWKRITTIARSTVRIGDHHRSIGQLVGDTVEWVWIGSHEDYNNLV